MNENTLQLKVGLKTDKKLNINLTNNGQGGVTDYEALSNLPQINGVTLIGNRTSDDIHVQDKMNAMSVQEIEKILYLN